MTSTPAPTFRRAIVALALSAPLASTGCAALFHGGGTAPSGLSRDDDRLRHLIADGRADSAFARLAHDDGGDELLRTIQAGVAAYYAGDAAESAALLDRALLVAEDRETRSVSRAALSLVTNDLALEWLPSPTERLLLPYYGALAYLDIGDFENAAVEARRLSSALARTEAEPAPHDAALRATLHRFAGAIFEAAGRRNDARVAYRQAATYDAYPTDGPAPDTAAAPSIPAGYGDVIVAVEHGFVAHRVEQAVHVFLFPEEVEALTDGDAEERAAVAALLAAHVVANALDPWESLYHPRRRYRVPRHHRPFIERKACRPRPGKATGTAGGSGGAAAPANGGSPRTAATDGSTADRDEDACDDEPGNPYLLRIAWPSYRATDRPASAARVLVDGAVAYDAAGGYDAPLADISRAVVGDFGNDRALIIAKTIARGAAKLALTRAAEEKISEKDETAGRIVGLLANAGNALLERADTRSLNLLPAAVGLVRLRLPAGEHALTLEVDLDGDTRRVPIGTVVVRDGGLTFATGRAF